MKKLIAIVSLMCFLTPLIASAAFNYFGFNWSASQIINSEDLATYTIDSESVYTAPVGAPSLSPIWSPAPTATPALSITPTLTSTPTPAPRTTSTSTPTPAPRSTPTPTAPEPTPPAPSPTPPPNSPSPNPPLDAQLLPLNTQNHLFFAAGSQTVFICRLEGDTIASLFLRIFGTNSDTNLTFTWTFPDGTTSFSGGTLGTDIGGLMNLRSLHDPYPNYNHDYIPSGDHILTINSTGNSNVILTVSYQSVTPTTGEVLPWGLKAFYITGSPGLKKTFTITVAPGMTYGVVSIYPVDINTDFNFKFTPVSGHKYYGLDAETGSLLYGMLTLQFDSTSITPKMSDGSIPPGNYTLEITFNNTGRISIFSIIY